MRFTRSRLSTLLYCITAMSCFIAWLPNVWAQKPPPPPTFLVYREYDPAKTYDSKSRKVQIWVASCPGINVASGKEQTLKCKITRSTCTPSATPADPKGPCRFIGNPMINEAPIPLVFGVSRGSDCVWVYDPTTNSYTPWCWD